jgi:hypothetical protein
MDALLLFLGGIAFVVSQYVLDSGVRTHVTFAGQRTTQYYTLSTCYSTFSSAVREYGVQCASLSS